MQLIEAIILGALQGLLEWLPVSSRGNLIIIMTELMNINLDEALKISIFFHIGTLLAAVVFFRKDLLSIVKLKDKKLLRSMIIVTLISVPIAGVLYYFVKNLSAVLGTLFIGLIGLTLIITGVLQLRARGRIGANNEVNDKDSAALGVAQGLSVIPGLSRSGVTSSTLLFRNINPKQALRYAFLMSIPYVLLGEIGLGLLEGFEIGINSIAALVMSFVVGLVSINAVLKIAESVNLGKFVIILGILSIVQLIFI